MGFSGFTVLIFCSLGVLSVFSGTAAFADDVSQVQNLLTNPTERASVIKDDPEAVHNDQRMKQIMSHTSDPAGNTEKMYEVSSKVFADITKEADGDPIRMQAMMAEFQKNPQLLEQHLSPENKRAIQNLSNQVRDPASKPVVSH